MHRTGLPPAFPPSKWFDVLCIIVFVVEKSMDVTSPFLNESQKHNQRKRLCMCVFCNGTAMTEGDRIVMATRQNWTEKTRIGLGISF